MVDKLIGWFKSLPAKFMNWWEKFTSRQKIAIVALTVSVLVAIVILIMVISKPQYMTIYTAETAEEANTVIELLKSNDTDYVTEKGGLVIKIKKDDYTEVNLLLGSNKIYADSYGIDNVTNGGFSTTESDKQKKYVVYLENLMKDSIESYSFVKKATVQLNIPEDDGTMISQNKQKSASILLELKGECTQDNAAAMAKFVATALGNDSTENITIIDSNGNMLFYGTDESSDFGSASSQFALTEQVTNTISNNVKKVIGATNEFSSVEVAAKIVLDNSYTELSEHKYWNAEDANEGVEANKKIYDENASGGIQGTPGTDSNTETTYQYEDNQYSTSTVHEENYEYLPNESTKMQKIPAGLVKYDESSITVTCIKYDVITEKDAKNKGLLDGISWDEYKANNNTRTKITVDNDLYSAVSTATGIDKAYITIIAYEEPFFVDDEGFSLKKSDVILILLLILILGLLAFVIIRSMKSTKVEEQEPEISIEEILKSTPVEEIEEIGLEDKSDARKTVEKFVEDNPEAVANLLRNWLQEDWQ